MGDVREPQLRLLGGGQARTALSALIPATLHRAVKVEAARRGVSVAKLVAEALADALHNDDGPPSAA
jgi:hypothetical protein